MHPADWACKWLTAAGPGQQLTAREVHLGRPGCAIRVDLVEGPGEQYWPRPRRIFAAARSQTFTPAQGLRAR